MRARSSIGRWPTGARRRISRIFASALLVAATASSGCITKVIVEPPPPCPEPPVPVLERILADDAIRDWYWFELDPYCEALYEANRNHGQ